MPPPFSEPERKRDFLETMLLVFSVSDEDLRQIARDAAEDAVIRGVISAEQQEAATNYISLRLFHGYEHQEEKGPIGPTRANAANAARIDIETARILDGAELRWRRVLSIDPTALLTKDRFAKVLVEAVEAGYAPGTILDDPGRAKENVVDYLGNLRQSMSQLVDRALRQQLSRTPEELTADDDIFILAPTSDFGDIFRDLEIDPFAKGVGGRATQSYVEFLKSQDPDTEIQRIQDGLANILGEGGTNFKRAYNFMLNNAQIDLTEVDPGVEKEDILAAQAAFDNALAQRDGSVQSAVAAAMDSMGGATVTVLNRSVRAKQAKEDKARITAQLTTTPKDAIESALPFPVGPIQDEDAKGIYQNLIETEAFRIQKLLDATQTDEGKLRVLQTEVRKSIDTIQRLAPNQIHRDAVFNEIEELDNIAGLRTIIKRLAIDKKVTLDSDGIDELVRELRDRYSKISVNDMIQGTVAFRSIEQVAGDLFFADETGQSFAGGIQAEAEATELETAAVTAIKGIDTRGEIEDAIRQVRPEIKGKALDRLVESILRQVEARQPGGAVPDIKAIVEEAFRTGEPQRILDEEAQAADVLETIEGADTFEEVEALVRSRAKEEEGLDIDDEAVRRIVVRVLKNVRAAAAEGRAPSDIGQQIAAFFDSGEAAQITEEAAAAAASLEEGSVDKVRQWFVDNGLLTPESSSEYREYLETVVFPQIAQSLDVSRIEQPDVDAGGFIEDWVDTNPDVIVEEPRFQERKQQLTLGPAAPGIIPTITGGWEREPTAPDLDPNILQGIFGDQLQEGATPGFVNFLLGREEKLLGDLQQAQRPSVDQALFDERTQMFSGILGDSGERKFTQEQTRQLALRGSQITPPTAGEFFEGVLPGLKQEFAASPTGVQEELAEKERRRREQERLAEEERSQSEAVSRRALTSGGRNIFTRIRR